MMIISIVRLLVSLDGLKLPSVGFVTVGNSKAGARLLEERSEVVNAIWL